MNRRWRLWSCLLVCLAALGWGGGPGAVGAQDNVAWSAPRRIPDYNDPLRAPFLVADQNRTVHTFNYEVSATGNGVLVYRRWSLARGWSAPVDIVVVGPRTGPQEIRGVVLDGTGRLHLVYYQGTERSGSVYYTWAYASLADQPSAWAAPVVIGSEAGPVVAGGLVEAAPGHLVAVYGGQATGIGLYSAHSTDAGQTWSQPVPVSLVMVPDIWPAAVWLTADELGQTHLVWHLTNPTGQGTEIRYARLGADAEQWEHETTLALRDTDLENMGWSSILAVDGRLLVAFQDGFPPTRWVRQSTDGGVTWSPPVRPFTHIGGYEYTALVKDSNNTVHMVLGNRIAQPEIHGMWYSRLEGEIWTPLVPITSGPSTASYDPCCPRAVMVQGNLLLATWPHNVRQEFLTGAWYSYAVLDAPELPVAAPPTPELTSPTVEPSASAAAPATLAMATATRPFDSGGQPPGASDSPAGPVLLALVPISLLVAAAVAWRRWRR